ncbi:Maf family protein [Williamsia maris]|uniref:Nucleoside triphosphate pyrophosphatase n=1 Tax=Williamsia maris TaxID=72806 RepID=A0ABT1H7N8_9NOCA|nr:Maf family nucleotide pyrophosphatase [Williamsia maris]MCP2174278.1 septum formation protein [Williamsia maris]
MQVVLGSASPARLKVLRAAGIAPVVRVSDVDEDAVAAGLGVDAHPEQVVAALAAAKAQAVRATVADDPEIAADVVVIGCDSMLLVDGRLTGKPHTADVARAQWMSVRGRSAQLLTGHCVIRVTPGSPDGHAQAVSSTVVRFADVDEATIDAYVASGEPLEVAGGFTLDGLGGWLIEGIDGDPSSVIGIGLPLVRRLLAELDVHLSELWTH